MATASELKLYVHESGSQVQPAILSLHGLLLSGRMRQPQLEGLQRNSIALLPIFLNMA